MIYWLVVCFAQASGHMFCQPAQPFRSQTLCHAIGKDYEEMAKANWDKAMHRCRGEKVK